MIPTEFYNEDGERVYRLKGVPTVTELFGEPGETPTEEGEE
jgi:hypothetical protein